VSSFFYFCSRCQFYVTIAHTQCRFELCLYPWRSEQVGTPYTVAPEIILGHYDEKSDIWSLGVITYLLLSGETPFGGLDGENLLLVKQNIMRAQLQFEPADVWENVSADAISFVKNLLKQDPLQRPTAKRAQKDNWIQIWAKKDTKGAKLNTKTINALMQFKEQSDMQKLLSEVLSFTLLPEQIVDLRSEFEKIDKDGDGEISLKAMKSVLMQNAEAGALGALTENEVEMLFESIRVRKHEPTIRWHEFLAAGLSQARVDDRNLRLAFDRMDTNRKGYITFEDLRDLLGNSAESDLLERVWMETLQECKAHLDRITYEDFLVLMKGQAKKDHSKPPPTGPGTSLKPVHETATLQPVQEGVPIRPSLAEELQTVSNPRHKKTRSQSLDQNSSLWNGSDDEASASGSLTHDGRRAGRAILLPGQLPNKEKALDNSMSPLLANRALYRMHREMRIAVLEASKTFDRVRNERSSPEQAGLIMKRGAKPPVELQDKHNREMYEAAAKRCGRARRTRNKTVSDVTGMIIHHQYNTAK
jgi:Ca2+-binding EF-hand superfamily protein